LLKKLDYLTVWTSRAKMGMLARMKFDRKTQNELQQMLGTSQ